MAEWSAAFINDLPDSAFAYIEPGGEKDDSGRTAPRSLRHFPHHGEGGSVDLPHLRNALARAPQSEFGDRALAHLRAHARSEDVGEGKAMGDEVIFSDAPAWKSVTPLRFELDQAKEGDVLIAFAKADGETVDKDGHITDLAAIPTKAVPMSAYGHSSWPEKGAKLPVGRADIGPDTAAKEAVAHGSFFLETTHGRDHYETVKGLGPLGEWSYGYKITAAAPTGAKTAKGARVIRLKGLDIFEVSPTLLGAGITRTIGIKSDEDGPLAGLPFGEDFDRVLVDVSAIVDRSKSLRELRLKEGRELSEPNRARLTRLRDGIIALDDLKSELEDLLTRTERTDPEAKSLGLELRMQYEATVATLEGVTLG